MMEAALVSLSRRYLSAHYRKPWLEETRSLLLLRRANFRYQSPPPPHTVGLITRQALSPSPYLLNLKVSCLASPAIHWIYMFGGTSVSPPGLLPNRVRYFSRAYNIFAPGAIRAGTGTPSRQASQCELKGTSTCTTLQGSLTGSPFALVPT